MDVRGDEPFRGGHRIAHCQLVFTLAAASQWDFLLGCFRISHSDQDSDLFEMLTVWWLEIWIL